jgi:hypothetical protein
MVLIFSALCTIVETANDKVGDNEDVQSMNININEKT